MKKRITILTAALCALMLLSACGQIAEQQPVSSTASETKTQTEPETTSEAQAHKQDAIPFADGQLYAVALVGTNDLTALPDYLSEYTDTDAESIPTYVLSEWEYYLVIPRYSDSNVALYRNDAETNDRKLLFEQEGNAPFLIQCNISDIFSDATIAITHDGETVEFSPYISLQDGSVQVGERGLNLTK